VSNLSASLLTVSEALHDHLKAGKTQLGLEDVWYDITGLVPRTPAILIEPDTKTRELTNTGFQTLNTFSVAVIIIHSRMASNSITNAECLKLAEDVESYIHTDRTLGGILIHSYVISIEQGSVTQQKVLLRATRLVWNGISKTRM